MYDTNIIRIESHYRSIWLLTSLTFVVILFLKCDSLAHYNTMLSIHFISLIPFNSTYLKCLSIVSFNFFLDQELALIHPQWQLLRPPIKNPRALQIPLLWKHFRKCQETLHLSINEYLILKKLSNRLIRIWTITLHQMGQQTIINPIQKACIVDKT